MPECAIAESKFEKGRDISARHERDYQYITRAMAELNRGDVQTALLILMALLTYFESCGRTMDEIHLNIITAVSRYKDDDCLRLSDRLYILK